MKPMLIFMSIAALAASCLQQSKIKGPKPRIVYQKPDTPIPEPRPVPRPGFVNLDLLEDTITLDLQSLNSEAEQQRTRYLVGCDRHNNGVDLSTYEQGVNLAMNRLSAERFLTKTTPIGNANCIFRLDLDDYTITRTEWREVVEPNTLFDFQTFSTRGQLIQFLTQSRKPYIFGDEICMMFECDEVADKGGKVYYDLVDQAFNTQDFLAQQGVVIQDQVNDEDALYSGFSQSPIALGKTRLIGLFDSDNGFCLSTYDTALGGDDLFINPFSLELAIAARSNKLFRHDAQEHICTSNNGLTVWRLNNAADQAEVEAPTNIVGNTSSTKDVDGSIRIGDCGNCHFDRIAIPFADSILPHILGNSAFDADEKQIARDIFNYDRITAKIAEINRVNREALADLDITAEEDPQTYGVQIQIRREMNADQVAGKVFLPTEQFLQQLRGTELSSVAFGALLNGGTVNLATLSENFANLVAELNAFDD
jgi:hypothetical protein